MEIVVRKELAAPLMTMLRLHDACYKAGVCAILTQGTRNIVEGITLSSRGLLTYLIEFDVDNEKVGRMDTIEIELSEGNLTYADIEALTGGILKAPPHRNESITMVTSPVKLSIIIGNSTYHSPLTEEEVLNYVGKQENLVLTTTPLPLLPKPFRFDVSYEGGLAKIKPLDSNSDVVEKLFFDIKNSTF